MDPIDPLKIPAYQRKKKIIARTRKRPTSRRKSPKLTEIPIKSYLPSKEVFSAHFEHKSITPSSREMKICGRCEGYFEKINVAIIEVTSAMRTGDQIIFETTDGLFEESLTSMQINRKDVSLARSGSSIGIKVSKPPKVGGNIYKVL